MKVDEAGAAGPPGRRQAAGDDRGVQPARNLRHDPPVRLDQRRDRIVHHLDQPLRAFVPAATGPAERRRRPHGDGGLDLGDKGDGPGIDRVQTRQRQPIAKQFRRGGDFAEHGPVYGEVGRQERIDLAGGFMARQHRAPVAPPDAVHGAGRIAQENESPGVVAPGEDVSSPARADDRAGERGRAVLAGDQVRDGNGPAPVADQEMPTPDLTGLETRPRPQQDLDVVDRPRGPPALARQRRQDGVHDGPMRRAEPSPVEDQIAVIGGSGRPHRQYRGV